MQSRSQSTLTRWKRTVFNYPSRHMARRHVSSCMKASAQLETYSACEPAATRRLALESGGMYERAARRIEVIFEG